MKKLFLLITAFGVLAIGCSKNDSMQPSIGVTELESFARNDNPTVNNCETTNLQQIKYEITYPGGGGGFMDLFYSDNCHHNYNDLSHLWVTGNSTLNKTVKSGDTCYTILECSGVGFCNACTVKVYQNCVLRNTVIYSGTDISSYFVVNTESGNCGGGGDD